MAKSLFSRQTVLSGMVIRSTVDSGIIDTIKLPPMESHFLTVEARDIRGDNRVKVAGDFIPLLSSNQISYKGQPIIALFGPDIESVQLKAQDADISYRLADNAQPATDPAPFEKEIGDFDAAIATGDLKTVTGVYDWKRLASPSWYVTRISVGSSGGMLHVYAPTQWPAHMRETISDITKIAKKQIVIHRQKFYAPHDEMLIEPSILAAIAALACVKGGYPVEIQDSTPVWRPAMHIERKSFFLSDGKPVAEQIDATVDVGAYALFTQEMNQQMLAGLLPPVDMKAARVSIAYRISEQPPASFFGDLGYSEALASTEAQGAQVARLSGMTPDAWKAQYLSSSGILDAVVRTHHMQEQKETIASLAKRSDFVRKYCDYETMGKRNKKNKIPLRYATFFGYARGIGMATGPGIAGLSATHPGFAPLAVQLELDAGDKVTVNTTFYGNGNSGRVWKQIISEKLDVPPENISFTPDGQEMVDSGPSVLASNSGRMSALIAKACDEIREKRFVHPLPLIQNVTDSMEGSYAFVSSGWASVVLEVTVDTVTFVPLVRNVWVDVLVGHLVEEETYRGKIRHTVVTTLRENGASLAEGRKLTIDVVTKQTDTETSSSVTSAIRALTTAAFHQALGQALGTPGITLPVTCRTIMEAMTGRKTT